MQSTSSNGRYCNMIETLFQNQIKVQEHLGSPLLNEREAFIKLKKDKGRCLRSLQMTADYLLFAVKNLNLGRNMPKIVKLKEITAFRDVWIDKKIWFYVSTISINTRNFCSDQYIDASPIGEWFLALHVFLNNS